MNIIQIFEDSFKYPLRNINNLGIFGILIFLTIVGYFILNIIGVIQNSELLMQILKVILNLALLFVSFIVSGYILEIVKRNINGIEEIPSLKIVKNLITGIKIAAVSVVYYLIPLAITIMASYFTGALNYIVKIISYSVMNGFTLNIPVDILSGVGTGLASTSIIWFILSFITTLFLIIGIGKLAETGNIVEAINIKNIYQELMRIGPGNYIISLVIYGIISVIFLFISFIFLLIPFLGIAVVLILFYPYFLIFSGRILGLVYKD